MAAEAHNIVAIIRVRYISCTFGMMPAADEPVLPATSRITGMLIYAEKKPSDFALEVPNCTTYVAKSSRGGGRCVVSSCPL